MNTSNKQLTAIADEIFVALMVNGGAVAISETTHVMIAKIAFDAGIVSKGRRFDDEEQLLMVDDIDGHFTVESIDESNVFELKKLCDSLDPDFGLKVSKFAEATLECDDCDIVQLKDQSIEFSFSQIQPR